MPPWENTKPTKKFCAYCLSEFESKRIAKFCSELCQSRARPARIQPTAERRKYWRLERLKKPGYRERINKQTNNRAATIRGWLDRFKMQSGCVDCGYNTHPVALDFDHIGDAKSINVCNAKSISQAKKEIALCEVVCSNCHRIRTAHRIGVRHSATAS